jgi:hypothetical protein
LKSKADRVLREAKKVTPEYSQEEEGAIGGVRGVVYQ